MNSPKAQGNVRNHAKLAELMTAARCPLKCMLPFNENGRKVAD